MSQVDHYGLIQKLLSHLEGIRLKNVPSNSLGIWWAEGYETAIDNAMNELRREL